MAETSISTPEQYADWIRSANPTRDALAESLRRWRDMCIEASREPTCCDFACYEDPGCQCEGCRSEALDAARARPDALREALDRIYRESSNYDADNDHGSQVISTIEDVAARAIDADDAALAGKEPTALDAPWSDANGDEVERGEPDGLAGAEG